MSDREADDRHHDGAESDAEGALPKSIGSWRRAYLFVLVNLALNVALFRLFGRYYS